MRVKQQQNLGERFGISKPLFGTHCFVSIFRFAINLTSKGDLVAFLLWSC